MKNSIAYVKDPVSDDYFKFTAVNGQTITQADNVTVTFFAKDKERIPRIPLVNLNEKQILRNFEQKIKQSTSPEEIKQCLKDYTHLMTEIVIELSKRSENIDTSSIKLKSLAKQKAGELAIGN